MEREHEQLLMQYLDGGLDEAGVRQLEELLAKDAEFAKEFVALARQERVLRVLLEADRGDALSRQVLNQLRAQKDGEEFVARVQKDITGKEAPVEVGVGQAFLPVSAARQTGMSAPPSRPDSSSRHRRILRSRRRFAPRRGSWAPTLFAAAAMLVLACGVYFALQGSVSSSNIVATVSDSSGSGVQADGIAGLRSLQAGDALAAGEIVRAEAGGRVRFQYRDGTWVELSAPQTGMSALLALTQATEKTAKQLRLDAGSLTADVRPQPNGQPFTVITPQARAVVRGTVLTLAVNADETRLDVRRGKVEIERLADRAKVSVAEGFYAVVGRQTALALEARSQSVAAVVAETKTPPAEPPVTPPPLPPNIDVRPPVATNTIARDTDTLRDGVASDFLTRVHTSAGGQRVPYRLFMPLRYDKTQKYPLVVFLHGIGEKGTDNVRTISNNANGAFVFIAAKNQADHPCFMLVPQSNSGWWGECAATLSQLLGALQQEYSIDADRCYVTGLSSGGSGAWDMILMYPKLFAAAVPICGNNNPAKASAAVGVAVWSFHTADDPTMKVEGSRTMIAALRKAGGKPFYTEYPTGGHSSAWVRAYQEPALVDWLFTQKRGRDATPPATLPFPH